MFFHYGNYGIYGSKNRFLRELETGWEDIIIVGLRLEVFKVFKPSKIDYIMSVLFWKLEFDEVREMEKMSQLC